MLPRNEDRKEEQPASEPKTKKPNQRTLVEIVKMKAGAKGFHGLSSFNSSPRLGIWVWIGHGEQIAPNLTKRLIGNNEELKNAGLKIRTAHFQISKEKEVSISLLTQHISHEPYFTAPDDVFTIYPGHKRPAAEIDEFRVEGILTPYEDELAVRAYNKISYKCASNSERVCGFTKLRKRSECVYPQDKEQKQESKAEKMELSEVKKSNKSSKKRKPETEAEAPKRNVRARNESSSSSTKILENLVDTPVPLQAAVEMQTDNATPVAIPATVLLQVPVEVKTTQTRTVTPERKRTKEIPSRKRKTFEDEKPEERNVRPKFAPYPQTLFGATILSREEVKSTEYFSEKKFYDGIDSCGWKWDKNRGGYHTCFQDKELAQETRDILEGEARKGNLPFTFVLYKKVIVLKSADDSLLPLSSSYRAARELEKWMEKTKPALIPGLAPRVYR
jgi:hypothetical protein